MTNEEILANAPEHCFAVDHFIGSKEPVYICSNSNEFYAVHLGEKIGTTPNEYPFSVRFRSLSDIRRIVELESELDKVYNDLANFEGYPEEVSALRRDIERRKQRYLNLLNKRKEWKKRAEAAERERNDKELEITVLETLLSNLWPGNYKPMDAVVVEITEALRQQLNGGE